MNTSYQIRQAKLAKWAALIKDQSESNLQVKEWCEQNNVTIHAYHYWKHKLKEMAVRSMMPDIAPLPVMPSVTPSSLVPVQESSLPESCDSRNTISSPVCLTLGDIRIEFGTSTSDEEIFRIIKAVRHA